MRSRHPIPAEWLISDPRIAQDLVRLAAALPRGSGIILRDHWLTKAEQASLSRALRRIGRLRHLTIMREAPLGAWRVHNPQEIRRARLAGGSLLLLSPMFETRSHPGQKPIPRMRSAALARLAGRPLLALGGMNCARFKRVRKIGFDGWAGIDTWQPKEGRRRLRT